MQYEGIRFTKDMRCPACRNLLARKFTYSYVYDESGRPIDYWGIGGLSYEEMEATYAIPCECGGRLEFDTPKHATPYFLAADANVKGPPVLKLT